MIGRIGAIVFSLALAGTLCLPALVYGIGRDDLILPRNASLRLETAPGGRSAPQWADRVNIGWPAKVSSVNGQWLQISDEGGYTLAGRPRALGWVRKDDVLGINDDGTLSAFASRIERARSASNQELARLHWLRGICREAETPKRYAELQIALADYEKATSLDATLADAWLRRGRILANYEPLHSRERWQWCFLMAFREMPGTIPVEHLVHEPSVGAGYPIPNQLAPPVGAVESLPVPCTDDLTAVCSIAAPPQLFLDIGFAYQKLAEEVWKADGAEKAYDDAAKADDELAKIKLAVALAEGAPRDSAAALQVAAAAVHQKREALRHAEYRYDREFDEARRYFECAKQLNTFWFRPAAAEADLFLTRVNKHGGQKPLGPNGQPAKHLSAFDLIRSVDLYNASIRLNDEFDVSYRGRAEALRLLATAPGFHDRTVVRGMLCPGSPFHSLLSQNPKKCNPGQSDERDPVLDAAYDSAKRASFLTLDRSAINLETRAKVEMALAHRIGANIGFEYVARASESLKDAMLYARSIADGASLNDSILDTGARSSRLVAFMAATDDVELNAVAIRATKMQRGVNRLMKSMPSLSTDNERLAIIIARGHHAIAEISHAASGKTAVLDPYLSGEPWPAAFLPTSELVERNARIGAWRNVLDALEEEIGKQIQCELEKKKNGEPTTSVFNELKRCRREWAH
ncbi:MAG TPA: hypothetical protein VFI31_21345 [Pirellulales bacterium]|nr:hypothetical protein [Pirellulales bacterium]